MKERWLVCYAETGPLTGVALLRNEIISEHPFAWLVRRLKESNETGDIGVALVGWEYLGRESEALVDALRDELRRAWGNPDD